MQELNKYLFIPLMIIGALNWGLIGFFGFNLVTWIFGPQSILTAIVYSAVGLAAVLHICMAVFGKSGE